MSVERQESGVLDWVASALANAKQKAPSGHDQVWTRLELMLRGKLSALPLTTGELKVAAIELAATMLPAEPTQKEDK
jgi:hypothetical protein